MQWILEYLKNNKTITNKTIREHFNIHKDTVAGDLKNLIKKGEIIRKGSGNNVWYELKSKK